METLAILVLIFLALRTFISLVNLMSRIHLPDKKPVSFPKVSVLIPARNEEAVLGLLLESLEKQDYPDFEVVVCDDHSSDNTEEILNWIVGEDERFHWFLGEKLQEGWLGKNFACHQLAQKAKGKYLVFLNANVELSPDAITKAVALFQEKELSLLSVFPQQKMESFAGRVILPVGNWLLQSLLPMILIPKSRFPSLSAANGQFMMFDAENYRNHQWHSQVSDQHAGAIRLTRMIKSEGLKIAVILGDNDIFCRMHRKLDEVLMGFSRNIHEYFGGQQVVMLGFWFIVCFGPFIVFFASGWKFFGLFVLLVFANRLFVAGACRQNVVLSVLLHPLQMISFTVVVFYAIFRRIKKESTWKVRKISFSA